MKPLNTTTVATTLLAVVVAGLITGCDAPGTVGASFGPKQPVIVTDTIPLSAISVRSIPNYSGTRTYVNAGIYNDPLFGRQETTAMLQPVLTQQFDTVSVDAELALRLNIDSFTGDSLSTSRFQLYELNRRWRQTEWRLDSIPPLSLNFLLEFDYTNEDTVLLALPPAIRDKYLSYHYNIDDRDSIYKDNFFGFGITGTSDDKMLIINRQNSRLIIQNGADANDVLLGMRQGATSLQHTPPATLPPSTIAIDGHFSNMALLEFEISDSVFGTMNLARAELVLYEDTVSTSGTLPPNHTRFSRNVLFLYQFEDAELNFAVTKSPSSSFSKNTSDASYRLDILPTVYNVLNGGELNTRFYVTTEQNSGIIRSILLHDEQSPNRFPALLVTKIIPE